MTPLLKVSVGPNVDSLEEIPYNDGSSHAVRSAQFDGMVSVYIKGEGRGIANSGENTYFEHESRTTRSWSIRIQGASSFAREEGLYLNTIALGKVGS